MHYVYIIQSARDGSFYTGISQDPEKRLREHNAGQTKSTKSRRPWSIVSLEESASRKDARKREIYLKSGFGREERDILFQSNVAR